MADQQQQRPPPNPGVSTQPTTSPTGGNQHNPAQVAKQPPEPPANKPPTGGGDPSSESSSGPLAIARDVLHRTVAGLIMTVIAVCAVVVWPLDFIYSMPWQRVERARRPRATRENLADPASPYYRIGEHQVFYLQDVHIIPEAQKQALAHLEPNKKALGYREITEVQQAWGEKEAKMLRKYLMTDYKWLTLAQVDERITTLEKAFRELGVDHGHRVLIYAETRIEWFLCAHAIIRTGAAIATLYATLGDEGLKYGIEETKATILVTSEELLVRLPRLLYTGMKHLVYFPTLQKPPTPKPPAALAELQAANASISAISYAELMALGARSKAPSYSLATTRITPDTPAVILYTSGSTGKPKGVVLTHGNFVHTVKAVFTIITEEVVEAHDHHCWYSFLPLAHILEFIAENTIFCAGIKIGYGSPFTMTDLSTGIVKGQPGDLTLLKPTVIPGVPLVLERIRKTIFEKLSKRSPVLHYLALWLVDYKTFWLEAGYQTPVFDWLVCTRFRTVFGGNVEYMLIGGAQLSPDTQRIMRALLNVQILIGYGSTETCGANMVMDLEDLTIGWTGAPLFGIKIRLADWPEGGYTHADKPYPRGELHVGGGSVSPGYFEQEEQTKEAFYRDGQGVQWFRTGDIVEVNAAGLVHIIDRRKDLVKMQHGEYISLGKIESELKNCLLVDNVCVHADSKHPYVIALIMPNWKVVKGLAAAYLAEQEEKAKGGAGGGSNSSPNANAANAAAETRSMIVRTASQVDSETVEKVRTEPAFLAKVLAELQDFARKETTLSRLETPERIYLCKEEWSPANDLLTAALKIKRFNILHFYADQVAAMYASSPT